MAAQKTGIPKGTRDFLPLQTVRRNYIFNTIKKVFELYGYMPIETPAMENLSTLMGKYGEEGDKLLFKILNLGNFLSSVSNEELNKKEINKLALQICGKGLRYDLTVPFARYVVQNLNEITFPFKRYQIQPVWRGDKPQKGRYREFYQCDADVIGSNSLINEVELIQIIDQVFNRLNIKVTIKLNNRKILLGAAENINEIDKFNDITIAVDKLDKIGTDKVVEELKEKGLQPQSIEKLLNIFSYSGSNREKIGMLKKAIINNETGKSGVEEIESIFNYIEDIKLKNKVELDISLARGLNYYTGTIIEVKADDFEIGSICGGGRYDDLTGIFGLPDISGVGISFGADRIYDVLEGLNLFPEETVTTTKVMFVNFGEKELKYCFQVVEKIREEGISCQIYPEPVKMKKQMTYADKNNIAYVALVGENEIKNNTITLKNMRSGVQEELNLSRLIEKLCAV
ncbi:MAG: histidine--tRNA ligase [Bacteroidales bacterium]|nr:histidine--tRNA ligase [Bacteroidales bacterium]